MKSSHVKDDIDSTTSYCSGKTARRKSWLKKTRRPFFSTNYLFIYFYLCGAKRWFILINDVKKALRSWIWLFSAFAAPTKVGKIPKPCNNRQFLASYWSWRVKRASLARTKLLAVCAARIIIGMFVYLSVIRIDTSFNGKLEFAEPFTDFTIRY